MNYEDRDTLGMYKGSNGGGPGPDARRGPGPEMMGADTLVGNDVFNHNDEDLGDIKEIMLDMRSGRVGYAVLSFGRRGAVERLGPRHREKTLRAERGEGPPQGRTWIRQEPLARHGRSVLGRTIHSYYGTQPYSDNSRA